MPVIDWLEIIESVNKLADDDFQCSVASPIAGGDIHQAYHLLDQRTANSIFIKLNQPQYLPMFVAEAEGLRAIAATGSLLVPKPIACGEASGYSFLAMEFLPLTAPGDQFLLGQQLALVHQSGVQSKAAVRYGFESDNFIGLTPQCNQWLNCWSDFWWESRLEPQLALAYQNGFASELKPLQDTLHHASQRLLDSHQPQSSLVHGDLWGGNKGFCESGQPVIFDPACYYGDREVDIAMTELFGGFSDEFYQGYNAQWPLDKGYMDRKSLYNLYHLLNHLNLFGRGYLSQVVGVINRLQKEFQFA